MSRRWVRGLIIAAAICVVAGGTWVLTLSDAEHYRWTQNSEALDHVLSQEVDNGMPVEELEQLLGPAGHDVDQALQRRAVRQFMEQFPADYPDGVEEGDEWIAYPTNGGMVVNLQTREGRLVNFNPHAFAQPMTGLR